MSLPSLDARQYAASGNALARALASTMRLPNLEDERQGIYRAAIAAILGALGRDEMDEDAAAALWTLVHTYLPYRIERPDEVDVEWSEEDTTMVQRLDQKWLADIQARGMASPAPGVEYPLYTPYGNEAAAQGLLDALHAASAAQTTDQEQ